MKKVELNHYDIHLQRFGETLGKNADVAKACSLYFSQSGEDIVVGQMLSAESEKGVFVDFGAYHPYKFSNTFLLYMLGWRGVNVDGNPDALELFKKYRPDDVNLHALMSDRVEEIEFYRFSEGGQNTADPVAAQFLIDRNDPNTQLKDFMKLKTRTPNDIFAEYVGDKKFDFLNIDVENFDTRLLLSIDFKRFRPKLIATELDLSQWSVEPLNTTLKAAGYEFVSQCVFTSIFRRID